MPFDSSCTDKIFPSGEYMLTSFDHKVITMRLIDYFKSNVSFSVIIHTDDIHELGIVKREKQNPTSKITVKISYLESLTNNVPSTPIQMNTQSASLSPC